ncbi:flagellar export chaperone FlgN [Marinicellulosiphila megalodicopiae]|uniref:flagellar export chaperone FlgN n=1 Tax=Marinicellulosiphila megalodicopiae TaxID=2724896 RepID=UPI003BB10CC1
MASNNKIRDCLARLNELLISHQQNCDDFSSMLSQEQEAIIQNNGDALLALLEKKQILLNSIESNQLKIDHIMGEQLGVDKKQHAFLRFLKQAGKDDALLLEITDITSKLWTKFIEQTQVIEQKNLVNGHLLNKQNAKNQLLIALLRGQKPQSSLYSENGKSSKSSYSSHLGKA